MTLLYNQIQTSFSDPLDAVLIVVELDYFGDCTYLTVAPRVTGLAMQLFSIIENPLFCKISGFHGGDYEEYRLL
jgi:hypothetical protein